MPRKATPVVVLTITELCERWRCTRHSVLDKIHAGELKAFRIGKRTYRVALAEVLRVEQVGEQAA